MSDLPRLLLIADGFASGRGAGAHRQPPERVRKLAAVAVAAGVRWVMLRDHEADAPLFLRAAGRLAERLTDGYPGVRLAVNTRADVARRLRAHLHVGTRGPGLAEARREVEAHGGAVGFSAHTPGEAERASREGAHYVTFSPVYRTASHPEVEPVGLDALRQSVQAASGVPVLALGGITVGRVEECLGAGAHGVAVLSAILDAHRPTRAVEQFLGALAEHSG